jgi:hypothetical protein
VDIRAGDDNQVIALFTMVVKGRGSGVELRRADALVAAFRRGKAVKQGYYNDQAKASRPSGWTGSDGPRARGMRPTPQARA